jgi:hypothetical protein
MLAVDGTKAPFRQVGEGPLVCRIGSQPQSRFRRDLDSMNNVGTTVSGVALERWLLNAAHATRMIPDKQKFFNELADEVVRRVLPAPLVRDGRAQKNIDQAVRYRL